MEMRWSLVLLAACANTPDAPALVPAPALASASALALAPAPAPAPRAAKVPRPKHVCSLDASLGPDPAPAANLLGHIATDVIQRIIRKRFPCYRACYADGLARDPNLAGRVTIKFAIDAGGHVTSAEDAGSDLPDREVVACIADEFSKLEFPAPDRGVITVVYPIAFTPGD